VGGRPVVIGGGRVRGCDGVVRFARGGGGFGVGTIGR